MKYKLKQVYIYEKYSPDLFNQFKPNSVSNIILTFLCYNAKMD